MESYRVEGIYRVEKSLHPPNDLIPINFLFSELKGTKTIPTVLPRSFSDDDFSKGRWHVVPSLPQLAHLATRSSARGSISCAGKEGEGL